MDFAARALEFYCYGYVLTALPLMVFVVVGFFLSIIKNS